MEIKNIDIVNANAGITEIIDQPVKGKVKFKLYKAKLELERLVTVIAKSLENTNDEKEREEILEETQVADIKKFTLNELEPLTLSVKQLFLLNALIDEEEE